MRNVGRSQAVCVAVCAVHQESERVGLSKGVGADFPASGIEPDMRGFDEYIDVVAEIDKIRAPATRLLVAYKYFAKAVINVVGDVIGELHQLIIESCRLSIRRDEIAGEQGACEGVEIRQLLIGGGNLEIRSAGKGQVAQSLDFCDEVADFDKKRIGRSRRPDEHERDNRRCCR